MVVSAAASLYAVTRSVWARTESAYVYAVGYQVYTRSALIHFSRHIRVTSNHTGRIVSAPILPHVLLVEDDTDTREVLRLILESDGMTVTPGPLTKSGPLRQQRFSVGIGVTF